MGESKKYEDLTEEEKREIYEAYLREEERKKLKEEVRKEIAEERQAEGIGRQGAVSQVDWGLAIAAFALIVSASTYFLTRGFLHARAFPEPIDSIWIPMSVERDAKAAIAFLVATMVLSAAYLVYRFIMWDQAGAKKEPKAENPDLSGDEAK